MNIREAIQDALKYFDDPPPNEASTCEWVILPLLHAAGYDRRDILSHVSDGGRGFPDYTILPKDEQHKFYLEAKAWLVMLEDEHARQSLNYANGNGKRWVVLTNGQEWRLYDNDRRGLPEEKLVAKVQLKAIDEAEKLLQAIGKQSVCTGKLEVYAKTALEAKRQRQEAQALAEECDVQLSKPESAMVKAMHVVLVQSEGLRQLKLEGIVAHFARKPPSSSQPFAPNEPKARLDEPHSNIGAEPAVFQHKALLINVNRSPAEMPLYEATRYAWKLKKSKAEQAEVVLATRQGRVVAAFIARRWLEATAENFPGHHAVPGRFGFEGEEAPDNIKKLYVGKRVPDEYRRPGSANPIKYTWNP